jgi:DNA invertase Pin-like site-specific DNA recombinase
MSAAQPRKRVRGPSRTKHRYRVVRLYRQGHRPAGIARLLKLTRQWVSIILKEAGVDALADAKQRRRDAFAEFQAIWEAAPNLMTAARKLSLTPERLQARAAILRRLGMPLKHLPRDRRPTKIAAILALHRQGMSARDIIRRGISTATHVYRVLQTLKPEGSNAGRVWTAAEDAMLTGMSNAEVAARTGRKVKAVAERRWRLRRRND